MSVGDANLVQVAIAAAVVRGAGLNNIVPIIMPCQLLPQVIERGVSLKVVLSIEVEEHLEGRSCQGPHCVGRIAALEVVIVTVVLGEGLLEDGAPYRLVFTDVAEKGAVVRTASICVRCEWQVVID